MTPGPPRAAFHWSSVTHIETRPGFFRKSAGFSGRWTLATNGGHAFPEGENPWGREDQVPGVLVVGAGADQEKQGQPGPHGHVQLVPDVTNLPIVADRNPVSFSHIPKPGQIGRRRVVEVVVVSFGWVAGRL